jgi:hypothetical protein
MSVSLNVHRVSRIEANAYSAPLANAPRLHCQTLAIFDADNVCIGQIVLFLDNPEAVLPVGDRAGLDGFSGEADALRALPDLVMF